MPPKKSGAKAPPQPAVPAARPPAPAQAKSGTVAAVPPTKTATARPRIGQPVKLAVNHYNIKLPTTGTIHHHDVEIKEQPVVEDLTKQMAKMKVKAGGSGGGDGGGQRAARPIPKKLKRTIIESFQRKNQACFTNPADKSRIFGVYDGEKNFYTAVVLPGITAEGKTDTVKMEEDKNEGQREKNFLVTMKLVSQLPIEALHRALDPNQQLRQSDFPISTLAAFQSALREALALWSPAPGSVRAFFFPANSFDLGPNVNWKRVWPGIFLSLRPNKWKFTLNLDVSHSVFSEEVSMVDFYDYFMLERFSVDLYKPGAHAQVQKFQKDAAVKEVYNLKVRTTHSGTRDYRVTGFSPGRLADLTFRTENGQQQKVVDYFRATYPKIRLEKLDHPAIQAGTGKNAKFLPMELCKLKPGQKMGVKLSEKEQAVMVKACAKPAWERQAAVESIRKSRIPVKGAPNGKLPFDAADNPYIRAFGIQIDVNMKQIDGRVLPMPSMRGETSVKFDEDGAYSDWKNPFKPADRKQPTSWLIINLSTDRRINMKEFVDNLVTCGKRFYNTQQFPLPLNYNDVTSPQARPINVRDFAACYTQMKKSLCGNKKPSVLMVIIPRKGGYEYADCKRFCDITEGVVSQMIAGDTLARQKRLDMYCSNVLLKINAKLNGTNQIVEIPKLPPTLTNLPGLKKLLNKPIIIFGADVTHPAPGEGGRPSIAAVTASMDDYFARYVGRVDAQRGRVEEIVNLKQMVTELLIANRVSNKGVIPQRLLFYRDGVSEGQYETVGINELAAIQAACKAVDPEYKPGITYMIVGKRHHTRMFPTDEQDLTYAGKKAGNVRPGTIIDTEICHYKALDYYLCSHFGLQGTSRPAHYHVLSDDNELDIDSIELFSFYLCFVYQRCLRSVSLPAPTYYAHHVAFRARHHLAGGPEVERMAGGDLRSVGGSSSGGALSKEEVDRQWTEQLKVYNRLIKLEGSVLNTQYFC